MDESWEDYHEPLARIFREVKKALPDWKKTKLAVDSLAIALIDRDMEVRDELERLLTQMIAEIENEK